MASSSPFADLLERSSKPVRTVAGLMSGTSADSIDVALCRMTGVEPRVQLIHHGSYPNDDEFRRMVVRAAELDVRGVAEWNVRVGERFAQATLSALRDAGLRPDELDVIGSHGQTVYHHSGVNGALRTTLQLGDGDIIAVRTGCYVISDFRARDIAVGGEGAPLSPIADAVLFGSGKRRVVLNLGGIANFTVLGSGPNRVSGFDVGPANAPLDRLAMVLSNGRLAYDEGGRIASAGQVNEQTLNLLIAEDRFLDRSPPKSTGFEVYGDAFLKRAIEMHGGADADLMATLVEFVARAIANALERWIQSDPDSRVEEVVIAGGGSENPALIQSIANAIAPVPLLGSGDLGIPSQAREAMIFAVLADMTLRGVPAWLPPITGAVSPKLLGKLSFP